MQVEDSPGGVTPADVVVFWFDEVGPGGWWRKDPELDARIGARFGVLHAMAARGELYPWRSSARGRLAEILVLDQFSRHLWRDTAGAYAQDGMALVLAQEAVAGGVDAHLNAAEKAFLYMPYMHSESPRIHRDAVGLYAGAGLEDNLASELKHKAIIDRFGRYPHRNAILGRVSSAKEVAFLKEPGSRF